MPVDLVQGWVSDRVEENLKEKRGGKGYKPTWWDKTVSGVVGVDAQGIADDAFATDQNVAGEEALTATGNSRSQLGLGEGNLTAAGVRGAKANYDKAETARLLREAEGRQQRTTAQLQAPGLEEARNTNTRLIQQGNQQMQLATATLAQQGNMQMMQMADSKDQRAIELQMRREDMDRLDRRDEKNRRRESIQALVAGLSSLGAAFAI